MRSKNKHPWRKNRSNQFAAYLDTLTLAERRQIETAERTFVYKTAFVTAPPLSRDYAESMVGAT